MRAYTSPGEVRIAPYDNGLRALLDRAETHPDVAALAHRNGEGALLRLRSVTHLPGWRRPGVVRTCPKGAMADRSPAGLFEPLWLSCISLRHSSDLQMPGVPAWRGRMAAELGATGAC
jgi:hypothetical protein